MRNICFLCLAITLVGCGSAPDMHPSQDPANAIIDPAKIHPSTADMQARAAIHQGKVAPAFALPDQDGKPQTLKTLASGKPALIYFVNHDCPCCVTAEPFIERLHSALGDRFSLFAIVDADVATTKAWRERYQFPGTMLADPTQKTIAAFGIETAVYQVLVRADGSIDKVYAGYNQASLRDIVQRIVEQTKSDAPKVEFADAPEKMTAGCTFEGPKS